MSVNAVYGKGDGYYLVVRGVENMEVLKKWTNKKQLKKSSIQIHSHK